MFYDVNKNLVLNTCPTDGYLPITEINEETNTQTTRLALVQGLDLADFETRKACGILPVISDVPVQPPNTVEDSNQRVVEIQETGVVLIRSWIPAPVIVPETISARQIRLWLVNNNMSLTGVENAINSIVNEQLRESTLVEWEYAPYVERNHPMVETLGQVLGLNSNQIDQAFIEASKL